MSLASASSLVWKCAWHCQGFTHSQAATVLASMQERGKGTLAIVKNAEERTASISSISNSIPPSEDDLRESRSSCVHCTMTLTVIVSSCSARTRNYSHTSFLSPRPLYRNNSGVPTIKFTSGNTCWRNCDLEERGWRSIGLTWHQYQNR